MNTYQKKSTAKYMYDISKGIAILAIVGNIIEGKIGIWDIIISLVVVLIFFISAYILEGGINNE